MDEELTAGAVFSGIGGFCAGFESAQFSTSWAIDQDPECAKTYRYNFPGNRLIDRDIRSISNSDCKLEPVDVLHAGFPCQSFSQAGSRQGFNDERGQLFYELMRLIKEFDDRKPSVLVFENTPFLRIGDGGAWFIEVQRQIKNAGYWFRSTSCAELDPFQLTPLPQMRNRLFMVAFAADRFKNGRITFPDARCSTPKKLSAYVDFGGKQDRQYYLPTDNRYHSMISGHIDNEPRVYQLRKYMVRSKEPNVCPTLTANMGAGGHNVPFIVDAGGLRKLTEYECATLQGFSKSFSFPATVANGHRYAQIGNSVCVPIAQMVAESVREKIVKERDQ